MAPTENPSAPAPSAGKTFHPRSDWLLALPRPLRFFLARCYAYFHWTVELLLFFFIDVLALAFVRRGNSGAVVIIKHDALGDYVLFRNFLEAVRAHPPYRERKLIFCGHPAVREMAEAFDGGLIDEFIVLDESAGGIRPLGRFRLLRRLKKIGAAVALHPAYRRSLLRSGGLIRATGAPERITWANPPATPIWSEKTGWINWKPP